MASDLFCLFTNFLADRLNKVRIPSRTIVQCRREQCRALDHQPHQALLVGYCRYAQAGFLDEKLLQGFRGAPPSFRIDGMCAKWPGDLPDPEPKHFFYIVRGRSLAEGIGTDPMIAVC